MWEDRLKIKEVISIQLKKSEIKNRKKTKQNRKK